jgi:hypothetical protein
VNSFPEEVRQYGTHNEFAPQAALDSEPLDPLHLDAIIVPASRPKDNLNQAITLARAMDCWLVILCSKQLRGVEALRQLATRSHRKAIVIDVPTSYSHELFRFPHLATIKEDMPEECHLFNSDLSLKRNIGLAMARMLNWRHIFFLDDDIREVSDHKLQSTVNLLGRHPAAGLWITEYPDNSVVCHANRITGGRQDVFVSGAALAVDSAADIGFFPNVYNEDWLFFFDYAADKRVANSRLRVTQLPYDPFAKPRRAAWQEFGDVLAEGLYALLHRRRSVNAATTDYWDQFLEARRNFLEEVTTRAIDAVLLDCGRRVDRGQVANSMKWALKSLQAIEPELCARYVELWREDLSLWKGRMARIGKRPLSIEAALATLQLRPAGPVYNVARYWSGPSAVIPAPAIAAGALPRRGAVNQMPASAAPGARPASLAGRRAARPTPATRCLRQVPGRPRRERAGHLAARSRQPALRRRQVRASTRSEVLSGRCRHLVPSGSRT